MALITFGSRRTVRLQLNNITIGIAFFLAASNLWVPVSTATALPPQAVGPREELPAPYTESNRERGKFKFGIEDEEFKRAALEAVCSGDVIPTRCDLNSPNAESPGPLGKRAEIGDGVMLRVLPIGDSITWGAQSSTDNGYRYSLHNKLTARGNSVDFVGSVTSGNFSDNQHEGHRGYEIYGIGAASAVGISSAPNIVLLHAGTNDMNNNIDVTNAPERLRNLIKRIVQNNPNVAVFVCQIIPAKKETTQARIDTFNAAIPDIVSDFAHDGAKITLVKMNEALTVSDLADVLHPNDGGYEKMAQAYYDAINEADAKGWITTPGTPTNPESCRSTPSWYNAGKVADGPSVAYGDGDFKPGFKEWGVLASGACSRSLLHFMDLDGDGLKDYACVDAATGATKVWISKIVAADGTVSNSWATPSAVATGESGRDGYGVMFADLNGDGRDDYIYVDPDDGEVYGWMNQGMLETTWGWKSLGRLGVSVGAKNTTLQFADIDGDGRADFLIVDPNSGQVTAWFNGGAEDTPDWQKLGVIATGASIASGDTIRLGDFTGEGRADYMAIDTNGKVNGYVNHLQEAAGLIPRWSDPFTLASGPDGATQDAVRLVDLTGDGKVDYLLVDEKTGQVKLWENTGTAGKYQPGEGVFLCDLDGDGTMDYFWVDHEGKGWGYLNIGKGKNSWYGLGMTADGTGYPRELVRMGVLTANGRADYIVVEEDTGRALWWENMGEAGNYSWTKRGEFATGPWKTIESYGWQFKGKNVRFADLSGDGLDDYVYVNDYGTTVMWENLGTDPISWAKPVQVADGVGVLARDVQFADTNGDGKLDYVVVDRRNGSVQSWHNLGFRNGSIQWEKPVDFADGTGSAGFAIKIAEMTIDARSDYVSIDPNNGRINLWVNRCSPISSDGND